LNSEKELNFEIEPTEHVSAKALLSQK